MNTYEADVGDLTPMLFTGVEHDAFGHAFACFVSPYGDVLELLREEIELRIRLLDAHHLDTGEELRALAALKRFVG